MTIFKVTMKAFDYWYRCDCSGFRTVEKYFTTREKAEVWQAENVKTIYCGFDKNHTEARDEFEMPTFKTEEITVE